MFTIRHIESNGYESLRECQKLWRDSPIAQQADCGCDPGSVGRCMKDGCPRKTHDGPMIAETPSGELLRFETGELFVMNDQGRTVAKYDWHKYYAPNI